MLVGNSLGLAISRHGFCRERMSALAVRALLLPLQKLTEDRFALRARKIGKVRIKAAVSPSCSPGVIKVVRR